jgi:hypothetical protein
VVYSPSSIYVVEEGGEDTNESGIQLDIAAAAGVV